MSFDNMKRSNNRHNFIAKQSHGQMPSQSPFFKSEADMQKASSATKTTAVKWAEVDPKIRKKTAKRELEIKLKARHSTTHQVIERGAPPGTVGNAENGFHAASSYAAGDAKAAAPRAKSAEAISAGGKPKPASLSFDGNDSSDDEAATDVYGWRFDEDGGAENDRNLLPESGAGLSGSAKRLGQVRSSLSSSMAGFQQSFSETFGPQPGGHPVLRAAKSMSQFAGATLLKTASFAAKAAVRISSKAVEELGKYMSQDEADQVGSLLERSPSFMKIHDLASSPTKDKAKKKRLEELHAAISEMRQFREEAEPAEAGQQRGEKAEKSLIQVADGLLNDLAFPQGKSLAAPAARPPGDWDPASLQLAEHAVRFLPTGPAVPEQAYQTLLDVKDMSQFQASYFSPSGKGLAPVNGRELHRQMSMGSANLACGGPEVASSKSPTSALLRPTSTLGLRRPPPLQLTAGSRVRPASSLKRPQSTGGLLDRPDWVAGAGPGGGLPPLRGSSFREPPPVLEHVDDVPAYVRALRKTGSYLKEQFGKAKEHLQAKLPRLESAPVIRMQTGKERMPPQPTATNGFSRSQTHLQVHESKESTEGVPAAGADAEAEAGAGRTPFSLLSGAAKASSFLRGLRPKSRQSSPDAPAPAAASGSSLAAHAGNGNLSERHRSMMLAASPGKGLPVIYAPQTARSELSEASLYSRVTSLTNMLEVSDGRKGPRFEPRSVRHLDLGKVAEVPEHQLEDVTSHARIPEAADVGPAQPEKDIGGGWRACWDFSAESVYYFNTESGEATWIAPSRKGLGAQDAGGGADSDQERDEHFYRIANNGLPRGMSELHLGDSELTIKTRRIAARHSLFSRLRSRYEGDTETEYTKSLVAKEYAEHAVAEENEIIKDLGKELEGWD